MAAADCIRLIREKAPDLTDEEIEEIVEELQNRLKARQARDELSGIDDILLDEADRLADEVVEASQIERRNRLINIKVRADLLRVAQIADDATGDPSLGLEARMVGVNAPFTGARKSVDARSKGLFTSYMGGFIADLRRENLLTLYNSRSLEREIAQELEQLTLLNGKRGVSGSKEAQHIAGIVDKYRKAAVARQNRAGAWIKPLPGYITRQSHDMRLVRRAGFEQWRDFILPLLDHDRTFQGANAEAFLKGAYEGISTGLHHKAEGFAEADIRFAFKGPGNLAKRISQHRVLHFKNADAWFNYNERFGSKGLAEALVQELERASRNIALMEAFGPNPRAMFDTIQQELRTKHKSNIRKYDRLGRKTLEYQFNEIDGTASIPVSPSWAHVGMTIRAVQTLSKLGGAFISSIADVAFAASEIRFQQGNLLGGWGQALTNLIDGLDRGIQRDTADLIGVGLDGMIGDIASRWSAQDHMPGKIAKLQQAFFKLNLLGPWTDANKRGLGLMMARDLAMKSEIPFLELPERTQRLLSIYDIDARKWDIARQATREAEDGRSYLMPDAIQDLPDEAFGQGLSARQVRQEKDNIESALRSYYVDRADFASPTPGARERAILRLGRQPGTPEGEAFRFISQFKAFPVTAITKPLGREVFGTGARTLSDALIKGQGDILGLANIIVGSTLLGYLAQSAKELTKGRTPRDPSDPLTWTAAMLQGGGLGLYGDFLLGESNRFGRSLTDTLGGPTLGTATDIDQLRAKAMAGDDLAAPLVKTLISHTPFINLFYTRAALDYLLFYQIQESANPGYLRRMERRIKRENNQTFILPPSRTIPKGGGTRLFEGIR